MTPEDERRMFHARTGGSTAYERNGGADRDANAIFRQIFILIMVVLAIGILIGLVAWAAM